MKLDGGTRLLPFALLFLISIAFGALSAAERGVACAGPHQWAVTPLDTAYSCRYALEDDDAGIVRNGVYNTPQGSDQTCVDVRNTLMEMEDLGKIGEWRGDDGWSHGFHSSAEGKFYLHHEMLGDGTALMHEAGHQYFGPNSEPDAWYWGNYCTQLLYPPSGVKHGDVAKG